MSKQPPSPRPEEPSSPQPRPDLSPVKEPPAELPDLDPVKPIRDPPHDPVRRPDVMTVLPEVRGALSLPVDELNASNDE